MPQLFNISFRPKVLVNKYDEKGNLIAQERLAEPIRMTALPYATAMAYKAQNVEEFTIEPYQMEAPSRGRSSRPGWGGAATKKAARAEVVDKKTKKPAESATERAARSGDLAAAVNS